MFWMETARLIQQCRQGDAEALGLLYEAYSGKMRNVCRHYISDRQATEDVVHDAFVIIFTSLDRLKDARKLEAWMMAITRNVALKYKDHLYAMPTVPVEEAAALAAEDEATPPCSLPLHEVMQMVDRLPEGYARVFRLSVFEGLSHKQIATMLDIEPHSSSSQLTRAKRMLRKSLQHYWMLWVLPLLLPVALYLFRSNTPQEQPCPAKAYSRKQAYKNGKQIQAESVDIQSASGHHGFYPQSMQTAVTSPYTFPSDTATTDNTLQPAEKQDTLPADTTPHQPQDAPISPRRHPDVLTAEADRQSVEPFHDGKPSHWGADVTYNGGLNKPADINTPTSLWGRIATDITSTDPKPSIVEIKTWREYIGYLYDADLEEKDREMLIKIAEANIEHGEDEIHRTFHHDQPVDVSLAVRRRISSRWSLETGLSYTMLTSRFVTGLPQAGFVDLQRIHYIGLPLFVSYQWIGTRQWAVYSSLGATLYFPVSASVTTQYRLDGVSLLEERQSLHAPLQWSVGTGVGLQYNITPNIGLFAEPRLQYFIPTGSGIKTYRSEHPLNLSLPFGIRFTW